MFSSADPLRSQHTARSAQREDGDNRGGLRRRRQRGLATIPTRECHMAPKVPRRRSCVRGFVCVHTQVITTNDYHYQRYLSRLHPSLALLTCLVACCGACTRVYSSTSTCVHTSYNQHYMAEPTIDSPLRSASEAAPNKSTACLTRGQGWSFIYLLHTEP